MQNGSLNKHFIFNSAVAFAVIVISSIPAKILLDFVVWFSETGLANRYIDNTGPTTILNFLSKGAQWVGDFIKVWVVAYLQASIPIFVAFWVMEKWNRAVKWEAVCVVYCLTLSYLIYRFTPDDSLKFIASMSIFLYVGATYYFFLKPKQRAAE